MRNGPLLTAITALLLAASPPAATAAMAPPNVIVVVTDDQAAQTMNPQVMPIVDRLLVRAGVQFTNSVVATPLCCPSRSVFLSGQYGHNNGVLWNAPGYRDLEGKHNTLPVWMERAGYLTAHVGKYLNGYRYAVDDPAEPAPGWSQWHTFIDPTSYYSTPISDNGRLRESGTEARDHTTSIINRTAVEMIRRFGPGKRPLFMVIDQFAPHRSGGPSLVPRCAPPGPEPAIRDADAFADAPLPQPPSFNEADAADKPSFVRDRDPYDAADIAALQRTYGCSLASLQAVDRGVGQIWRQLGRIGERRNTALVFTSDNGLYFGEHRLSFEKTVPYRESVEVPLAMRLPAASKPAPRRGGTVDRLVANVDLPATILDLAGAEPCRSRSKCRVLDGRSLLRLAGGEAGKASGWPADRAIPLELDTGGKPADPFTPCVYQGLRTADEVYLHHTAATGADGSCSPVDEAEHYDLGPDPFQLTNLLFQPSPMETMIEAALARRAEGLSGCSGIRGRDHRAAGRSFCE